MKKILFIILMATCTISISAQKKNVIIDVSHDVDTIYTYVNPNIFNLYKDIVEKQMGANLIINKDKELNEALLSEADLLVILSPLNRERVTTKRDLTSVERKDIVNYVQNGGRLILFMDEEHRVDMKAAGLAAQAGGDRHQDVLRTHVRYIVAS